LAAAAAANDCCAAARDDADGERDNVVGGIEIDIPPEEVVAGG
jgi:hypothetical protein